mgnify:CR=1 FL=1
MAISNISTASQPSSVSLTNSPAITHAVRKERSHDDRSDSSVVTLSTHARDLHRSDAAQTSADEHIEQIRAINRSDEMAQEKLAANTQAEARVLEAKQKEDERFIKKINTYA